MDCKNKIDITYSKSLSEYVLSVIPDDVDMPTIEVSIPCRIAEEWAQKNLTLTREWERIRHDQTDVEQGTESVSVDDYLTIYATQDELEHLMRWAIAQIL